MRNLVLAGLAVLAYLTGGTTPLRASQPPALLYVCVQDDAKIAVVDMAAAKVVRTIDLQALGYPATAKPHYIVVEPGGAHWYVSLIGANRVVKFDRAGQPVAFFEMETPGMLSLAGANQLAVSRSMSAVNPPKRIALINRESMTGTEVDILFPRPHPMGVARGFAYTASLGVNQMAAISLADEKVTLIDVRGSTDLGGSTHAFVQFAVSPDGGTMVGSTEVSGQLLIFSLAVPWHPTVKASIPLGKMVFDPVFTPDGKFVWVPVKMSNEIAIIDAGTWKEVTRIKDASFMQPHQVVFSPDGRTAFVTNNNKMDHMADPAHAGHDMPGKDGVAGLSVIDVATRKVTKTLPLGKNLTGMGR